MSVLFPLYGVVFSADGTPSCACGDPACDKAGKHPRVVAWPSLTTSVPPGPGDGIGVLCGSASRLVVVDIDRADAEVPGELPETFTVRTSRGTHRYYELPEGAFVRTRHGDGWDLVGEPGFVVGPGSMHRTGVIYEPIDAGVMVAPAPAWILSYAPARAASFADEGVVRTPGRVPTADDVARLRAAIAEEGPAVSGQNGHDVTFRFLQRYLIVEHWDAVAVRPLLDEWNARCVPPWDAEDFDRKIQEVLTKSRMPEGGASVDLNARLLAASQRREAKERTSRKHTYQFADVPRLQGSDDDKPHTVTFEWVRQALAGGQWTGCFRRDLFYGTIRAVEPIFPLRCEGNDGLKNADVALMRSWLERELRFVAGTNDVVAAIEAAAQTNDPFHPVRNYLDGLPATTGAIAEFAAMLTKDPTDALAIRVWLLSAVARIYDPGAHVDMMLILAGQRGGEGKSSTLRALFGNWHRSNLPDDLGNAQKAGQALQGSWCVEMGELPQFKKTDRDTFKDFLTRTHDKFRAPYERSEENHARQCVFAGTSNSLAFLDQFDTAFRRRFYAIEVRGSIDVARVARMRDAIWAEARDAYRAGEAIYLEAYGPGVAAARDVRMASFDSAESLDDCFDAYVAERGLASLNGLAMTEIWMRISPRAQGYPPRADTIRLGGMLSARGFTKGRNNGRLAWYAPGAMPPEVKAAA